MGVFHLGSMTLKAATTEPITVCYPFQTKEVPEGLKGHIENDIETCIFCSICAKKCPADAIEVDRAAKTWTIDGFRCIQCHNCIEACPKSCLSMKPEYTAPATKKEKVQYGIQ